MNRLKTFLAARRQLRRHGGNPPTPDGSFRLIVLDDHPYPTYTGWRSWCTGEQFWDDGACQCRHMERRPDSSRTGTRYP